MVLILRVKALHLYFAILTEYALQSAYSDLGQYLTEELSHQGTIQRYPLGTRTQTRRRQTRSYHRSSRNEASPFTFKTLNFKKLCQNITVLAIHALLFIHMNLGIHHFFGGNEIPSSCPSNTFSGINLPLL